MTTVALVLGLSATPLGVIGWAWTGAWPWVVTGLMLTLVLLLVAGALSSTTASRDRR